MSQRDVIIACDFASAEATLEFLDKFTDCKPFVKIGMELYYAAGPAIVKAIKERGHKIFLDLKLHDIPNTVKKAMAVLSKMDVDMPFITTGCHSMAPICCMYRIHPDRNSVFIRKKFTRCTYCLRFHSSIQCFL